MYLEVDTSKRKLDDLIYTKLYNPSIYTESFLTKNTARRFFAAIGYEIISMANRCSQLELRLCFLQEMLQLQHLTFFLDETNDNYPKKI